MECVSEVGIRTFEGLGAGETYLLYCERRRGSPWLGLSFSTTTVSRSFIIHPFLELIVLLVVISGSGAAESSGTHCQSSVPVGGGTGPTSYDSHNRGEPPSSQPPPSLPFFVDLIIVLTSTTSLCLIIGVSISFYAAAHTTASPYFAAHTVNAAIPRTLVLVPFTRLKAYTHTSSSCL